MLSRLISGLCTAVYECKGQGCYHAAVALYTASRRCPLACLPAKIDSGSTVPGVCQPLPGSDLHFCDGRCVVMLHDPCTLLCLCTYVPPY